MALLRPYGRLTPYPFSLFSTAISAQTPAICSALLLDTSAPLRCKYILPWKTGPNESGKRAS